MRKLYYIYEPVHIAGGRFKAGILILNMGKLIEI